MRRAEEKKHIKQMKKEEVRLIREKIKNKYDLNNLNISPHYLDRVDENLRGLVLSSYIDRTILKGNIIEYKILRVDDGNVYERIVLRDKIAINGFNICLVYEVTTNSLITVWLNHYNDNHTTLNLNKYRLKNILSEY